MAKEPQDLLVSSPRQGIAQSPHIGFGDCRNIDIYSIPGVALLNNLPAKKSGATVTGLIQWLVKDPVTPANIYGMDNAGVIYKSTDSGATWALLVGNTFTVTIASPAVFSATAHGLLENDTVVFATTGALPTGLTAGTTYYVISTGLTANAFEVSTSQGGAAVDTSGSQSGTHTFRITLNDNGNGLQIWKGYLFKARNAKLDTYGPLASSPVWTNNWKAIDSDALWHPMIKSKNDNKLYGGAGLYVFSLDEVSGQTYAPTTSGTYTFTAQALDLPPNYRIKCLEELGNNLMCGTWMGTNVYDFKIADIFPWDRSSTSFGQPICLEENGTHALLTIGSYMIVLAGIGGTIYKSDGVNAYPVGQIPQSIADISNNKYIETYPGALINYKGKPYFGVSSGGIATTIAGMAVYSLFSTSQGNILIHEHTISEAVDGSSSIVKIGALCGITRDNLLIGWRNGTTYGIDAITTSSFSTGYTAYFDSPLYQVGTPLNKRQFTQIDIQFAKKLAANQGIRVQYRVNLTDSFTTINTWVHTATASAKTIGAVISHNDVADIPECEFLQIRVLLSGTTTTPNFRYLILR